MIQMNLLKKQTDSQTENKLVVTKAGRLGGDKLGAEDQQIQTTTCEINKMQTNTYETDKQGPTVWKRRYTQYLVIKWKNHEVQYTHYICMYMCTYMNTILQ